MHPGLHRLLDLIRVNPQDSLLVDRFLILAADLDESTRVDATLGLSEALLRKNPRRAIELAHMVYKARPGESQPIELMVEGLENLGRYGKATVLRAELEKVRKARETNPGVAGDVTEASVITIDKELQFLAAVEIPPPPAMVNLENIDIPAPPRPVKKIKFTTGLKVEEPTVLLEEMQDQPDIFSSAVKSKRTSVANSDANPPMSQMAPGIPVFREVVPDADLAEEERELLANRTSIAPPKVVVPVLTEEQCIAQIRTFVANKQWDDAWKLIEANWPLADNHNVLALFQELNLAPIDHRYMGWWLDGLVFDRRPRYALNLAIKLLQEQPHMALARMTIARIQKILRLLGFREVQWQESEGVLTLLGRLDLSKLQTPAAVGIFRPRRVS